MFMNQSKAFDLGSYAAVRRTVEAERVYILSLGSQQGNRHVHWHIAPLPYGVPFKEQQLEPCGRRMASLKSRRKKWQSLYNVS
jgi:hypothetical protein